MTLDLNEGLETRLSEMHSMLVHIQAMLAGPREIREWYTVEEVAETLGKKTYTVREWCREGRINASKRSERRGGAELWNISAGEVARYKNEGFLPAAPRRNGD